MEYQNVKTKKKKKQSKKTKAPPAPEPPSPQVEEEVKPSSISQLPGGKSFFALGDDDSDDAMDEDDLKADDLGLNWVTNSAQDASADDEPAGNGEAEDSEWEEACKAARASKAQEAYRAKREEKMRAKAEVAAQKRMAEAQELGEQARARREEQEAKDARLQEEQEREAEESRKAAREEAIKEVNDQRQTVDLDSNWRVKAELAAMGVKMDPEEIDQEIEYRDVGTQNLEMKRARSGSDGVDNSSSRVKRVKTNVPTSL